MNNKIGYKTQAYKNDNYQLAVVQPNVENQETTDNHCTKEEVLQSLGWDKASDLLSAFFSKRIMHGDVLAKELTEIRKHFFNTI